MLICNTDLTHFLTKLLSYVSFLRGGHTGKKIVKVSCQENCTVVQETCMILQETCMTLQENCQETCMTLQENCQETCMNLQETCRFVQESCRFVQETCQDVNDMYVYCTELYYIVFVKALSHWRQFRAISLGD